MPVIPDVGEVRTVSGKFLATVPDGDLAWVEDAPLSMWSTLTLMRRLSYQRRDSQEVTSIVGPPGMVRRWKRYWEKEMGALEAEPPIDLWGYWWVEVPLINTKETM